jgi:ABC-type amino acid transport substrate-binding protein
MSFPISAHSLPTLVPGTLSVAAFSGFAPFAWRDGRFARGRDINFLHRFASAHGLSLTVRFHKFDRLWELPAHEYADVAASGISLRGAVAGDSAAWTRPYCDVRRTLLIRTEDREKIRGMKDLGRLAVVPNSIAQTHAEETLPSSATLESVSSLEHGIEDLLLGQVDALGTGSVSAEYHAARHPGLAMVDVHGDRPPEPISFTARPKLVESLNSFIQHFRSDY